SEVAEAELADTARANFLSVDSQQMLQELLNELNAEGLVSLPTCADGDVPFAALGGIRTGGIEPLPGIGERPDPPFPLPPGGIPGSGDPYTTLEVDIRTNAGCEDLLPPPNQDGYTDPPQDYMAVNFMVCDEGQAPPTHNRS